MRRCPNPDCGTLISDGLWHVEDLAARPYIDPADAVEVFSWHAVCPGCALTVFALHDRPADPDPVSPDPAVWACPLCGHPTSMEAGGGPVIARGRCQGGCGALVALQRTYPKEDRWKTTIPTTTEQLPLLGSATE